MKDDYNIYCSFLMVLVFAFSTVNSRDSEPRHRCTTPSTTMANQDLTSPSHALFEQFVQAQTCKEVQRTFSELCHHLQVDPRDYQSFYTKLKERLNYWKAKSLWVKLDKRAQHQDYQQGEVCAKNKACIYLFILIYEKRNTQEVL